MAAVDLGGGLQLWGRWSIEQAWGSPGGLASGADGSGPWLASARETRETEPVLHVKDLWC